MVALKAELSPVIPGVPGLTVNTWDVSVAAGSDALPGTGTSLGTFEHNSATDPVHKGLNHAVFHHIQSILYRRQLSTPANSTPPAPPAGTILPPGYNGPAPGSMFPIGFHDMSQIKIKRYGATMLSTAITAAGVTMAVAATATLVVKGQPGDTAVANADCTFTTGDPGIATVSTAGVVTGVAAGSTYVRIINKFNGLTVDAGVTVTAATLLSGKQANEDVLRDDDEQVDNRKKAVEKEEEARKKAEKEEKEAHRAASVKPVEKPADLPDDLGTSPKTDPRTGGKDPAHDQYGRHVNPNDDKAVVIKNADKDDSDDDTKKKSKK
jgi:hypothetical protein